MKKVLLRAPLLTNSGYGIHSRQVFRWLDSRKDLDLTTQCLNWGHTPWVINPDFDDGLYKKIMTKTKEFNGKFDITFQVQLPDEWDVSLGHYNVGVTALVETDRCNYAWLSKIQEMDKVIVPSQFTKDIIINSFGKTLETKVVVIPEWFNTCLEYSKEKIESVKDERYKFDTKFNLLTIGTLTSPSPDCDRKNLINTIVWAIEAFEGQKDVGIIVKTNMGKGSKKDRKTTLEGITQVINQVRKSDFPRVHLIHGNMSDHEVASLFRSRDVHGYITATRGEGYGLPLIEAAASSLPIVATNWSGHLDFLGSKFSKVNYQLVEIPSSRVDNRIFMKGSKWADPQKDSYIQELKNLKTNYDERLKEARILKKQVVNKFSKEKICKKYDKFLNEACQI